MLKWENKMVARLENGFEYDGETRDGAAGLSSLFADMQSAQQEKTEIVGTRPIQGDSSVRRQMLAAMGPVEYSVEVSETGTTTIYDAEGNVSEEVTNHVRSSVYGISDANGDTINVNMSDTPTVSALKTNRDKRIEETRVNQAGTAANAKTTIAASEAPVRVEELSAAVQNVQTARNAETAARNKFVADSSAVSTRVTTVTESDTVQERNDASIEKLNNLYPDPASVEPNSQQRDLLNKYNNISDVPADDVEAYNAAVEQQEKYNTATENLELRREVTNYQTQVSQGNTGVIDNGDATLASIDDRLSSLPNPDPSGEREQLEALRTDISDNNASIKTGVGEDSIESWRDSKENLIQRQEETRAAETRVRDLRSKEGGTEAFTQISAEQQQVVASIGGTRPSGLLDARSTASSNKIVIDAFSNRGSPPFYLQMPTLKAISSFHLRNGFSPYGSQSPTEVARDALHFNIFEGALGSMETVDVPNTNLKTSIMSNGPETTMGSFTIYPNDPDWLSLSHNHSYSDENPIASAINPILQFVNTGANLLKTAGNLSSSGPTSARTTRRLDFIDQYQNTEKLNITVPFVLFTKGDFVNDIYAPIMFLTALSYPSRLYKSDLGDDATRSVEAVRRLASNVQNETGKKALDGVADFTEGAGEVAASTENLLLDYSNTGAFRYVITQRPEYMSVRHASGLFFFKLAVITSFSYNFKGPWINSDGEIIDNLDSNAKNIREVTSAANALFNRNNTGRRKMPFAFPSIAECSVTIKSVEPLFRQDWLSLLNGAAGADGSGLVRVSEQNTGTNPNVNLVRGDR